MWHRVAIPDLLLAVTALHHNMGVVHIDADFDRIAEGQVSRGTSPPSSESTSPPFTRLAKCLNLSAFF
jgi:hypothetical protein